MLRKFLQEFFCFFVWAEQFKTNFPPNSPADKSHTSQQLVFRKFKKVLYVLGNCFTCTRIKVPMIFTIIAIILPYFIIMPEVYSFQVMPKTEISNLKFFETIRINTITVKENIFVVDVNQRLREDFPKSAAASMNFCLSLSFLGITLAKKAASKAARMISSILIFCPYIPLDRCGLL